MKLWLTILCIIYLVNTIIGLLYYLLISIRGNEKLTDSYLSNAKKEPFVSIIIPTYNEERNIEKCLHSLRKLNYSRYEVIVSDGGSNDNTVQKAKPLADKIVIEKELPDGWIGKNYGCHIGYEEAEGDILLFTDADTIHHPNSLRIMVSMLLEKKIGLLTSFPYQELRKWWESIVPIYFFLSHLTSGGLGKVNDPKEHDSFLGVGQYLLFTREAYEKIGGHVRIKGSIIEDYAFARLAKTQLHSLFYTPANKLITAHMYPESFRHCWTGFKKVLFAGTKLTPSRKIAITLIYCLISIFSPVMIILIALYSTSIGLLVTTITIHLVILATFATFWNNKGRHFWVTYVFFPYLMLVFIFTMIASTLELVIAKKTIWKGRKYEPDLYAGLNGERKFHDELPTKSTEDNLLLSRIDN